MAYRGERVIKVREMEKRWGEYKEKCDNRVRRVTEFSQKLGEFFTGEVAAPVPYDIQGFCVFLGITRQAYYKSYCSDERYRTLCERISAECECSKREAFEQGTIPAKLVGLWMQGYDGYRLPKDGEVYAGGGTKDSMQEAADGMTIDEKAALILSIEKASGGGEEPKTPKDGESP